MFLYKDEKLAIYVKLRLVIIKCNLLCSSLRFAKGGSYIRKVVDGKLAVLSEGFRRAST